MREGVGDLGRMLEEGDRKNRGSDITVEPTFAQNTGISDPLKPSCPPTQDHNTPSTPHSDPNTPTTTHAPPTSRLRPRRTTSPNTHTPNSSRSSSKAPTQSRKPRKPTKDSLLNDRRAFQKSRAWQQALLLATEALERHEAVVQQPVPTERERVLAKRIVADRERLMECRTEIGRLRRVREEQREVVRAFKGGWRS